jgi:hypothetical protein
MSNTTKALVAGTLGMAAAVGLGGRRADASFLPNPAVINSSPAFNGSLPVANVFDGTSAEYASAGQGANTFVDFDFGAPRQIDAFDLVNRPGATDRVTGFNLTFSADSTFGDAGDTTVGVSQDYTGVGSGVYSGTLTSFAPQTARYVRWAVTSTAGSTAPNQGAAEMRFRSAGGSTRLAPGAVTVVGSATPFSGTYVASRASDGKLGNGAGGDYSSNGAGANTFIDFDLGSTPPVTGFELMQRLATSDRATGFDMLFSNDPTFAAGVTTRSYADPSMSVSDTFAAVNARYVRLDVTGGSGNVGAQEVSFIVAPEPGSVGLLGVGLAPGALRRRRRRAR